MNAGFLLGVCVILGFGFDCVQCLFPMLCEESSPDIPVRAAYPWMARVIPHPETAYVTLCVASCIHPKVFYTAARCLIGLTVGWVGVDYRDQYLRIKAMVTTRGPPHHQSDGFAVTEDTRDGLWDTVTCRIGPTMSDYKNDKGLIMMKVMTLVITSSEGDVKTAELDVVVESDMTKKRFDGRGRYNDTYKQWGFHPCTEKELENALPKCNKYIKVTGAPLVYYNQTLAKNIVIGVATWSDCSNRKANYPVVFSSISHKEANDVECAKMIAHDKEQTPVKGYYDTLCSSKLEKPLNDWFT